MNKFISAIFFFLLFCSNISSEVYITEIINNTDTPIDVFICNSPQQHVAIIKTESLLTQKEVQQSKDLLQFVAPRTRNIIDNLSIPRIDIDHADISVYGERKGINFRFQNKHTVSYSSPGLFIETFQPFLAVRKKGDFMSIVSPSGSIKSFNFFGEDIVSHHNWQGLFDGLSGENIIDGSTYSIEINQIIEPSHIRNRKRSFYAYVKNSISVVFRKNKLSAKDTKSILAQSYPVASILNQSYKSSTIIDGLTNVTINFNKAVTPLFIDKFCQYMKNSKIGKFITIQVSYNECCLIHCSFYEKIKQEDIQDVLNQANKIQLPQYDF